MDENTDKQIGCPVRYFVNDKQYIIGEIVEICENNTAWVHFSNGQELNIDISV